MSQAIIGPFILQLIPGIPAAGFDRRYLFRAGLQHCSPGISRHMIQPPLYVRLPAIYAQLIAHNAAAALRVI